MLVFKRILIFIILFVVGVLLIKYREQIAKIVGKNDLAEKYLGAGGTYNLWVIIGIITTIAGAMVLLGKCTNLGI